MKLRCTLLLVLALTLFTGLAKADPVDPTVIINDPPGLTLSTECPSNALCLFDLPVPTIVLQLVKGFLPPISFTYTGPDTNTLYVVLDEVVSGETFTCASNFLSCTLVSTTIDIFDHDAVVFKFTGAGPPGTFALTTGRTLTASVPAPEPGLMCQLLLGVLPLLFFGRKYWVTAEAD